MKAELKRLIQNLGELAALADDLEKLKSIDQAEAEAKARLAALQRDADALMSEAAGVLSAAKVSAEELRRASASEADAMMSEARKQADAAMEQAGCAASETVRQAEQRAAMAQAEQAAAEHALLNLGAKRALLEHELGTLESRLAEVRALLAPFVG